MVLHKAYSRDDVVCISVSLDYGGDPGYPPESFEADVLGFLKREHAEFDNVLATEPVGKMLEILKLENAGMPGVFVYGRDGKLAKQFDNGQPEFKENNFTYDHVEKLVAKLVKE